MKKLKVVLFVVVLMLFSSVAYSEVFSNEYEVLSNEQNGENVDLPILGEYDDRYNEWYNEYNFGQEHIEFTEPLNVIPAAATSVTNFTDLQAAINTAGSIPTTIEIVGDIIVPEGSSIEIGLAPGIIQNITFTGTGSLIGAAVGVTTTIDEDAPIDIIIQYFHPVIRVRGGSTLTLDGPAVTRPPVTGFGRGIHVINSTLILENGFIEENNARPGSLVTNKFEGGGVLLQGVSGGHSYFNMTGGQIRNNGLLAVTGASSGGGVLALDDSVFTMSGGTISGNTSTNVGGGVAVYLGGTFQMTGGTIARNTAVEGGGVVMYSGGSFRKTGGVITGYSSDRTNGNRATREGAPGHAVLAQVFAGQRVGQGPGNTFARRNSTADERTNLSVSGPTASGAWE